MGGKTGTAETQPRDDGIRMVSFIGCVSADNLELLIYVVINEPNIENQEQSKYIVQLAKEILEEVLPQQNMFPYVSKKE